VKKPRTEIYACKVVFLFKNTVTMSHLFQRGREKLDKTRESLKRRGESLRRGPEDTEEVRQPKIRKTGDPIPPLRLRNPTGTLISKPEDIPDDWDPNDDDIDEK
jgi:hypothetical protein